MNSLFEINKVYSNTSFCQLRGKHLSDSINFYVKLYETHPEDCPWPIARREYQKHIDEWKDNMVNYIIPIKRTKNFLEFEDTHCREYKKKIRVDENGDEYILQDNIKIFAGDIMAESPAEIKTKKAQEDLKRGTQLVYITKLAHLEEYGYTYLPGERVESIDELNKAFGK